MIEKLIKYGRDVRRQVAQKKFNFIMPYFFAFMGTQVGVAAAMAVAITSPVSAPLTACFLAVGCAVGAFAGQKILDKQGAAVVKAAWEGDFLNVIGIEKNVDALKATQRRIQSLTQAFQLAAQLPPKVESKLQDYLRDAAELAAHVRVYDLQGQEKDEIIYTREVFNAQGQYTWAPVGAVKTERFFLMAQQPALTAPVSPAPVQQKVKVLKPLQYTNKPQRHVTP